MSDFAGLWRLDGRPVSRDDLHHLAFGLRGRTSHAPSCRLNGATGFVHCQHVFTPQDAHERMPLVDPAGNVLVADVCLTGRANLSASLNIDETADLTDGYLIQRSIARWGVEGALARLYGPFSLAYWDAGTQRLFLAREPHGKRTLYFARTGALIGFSNRAAALVAHPDIPVDLDELAVAESFTFDLSRPHRTVYRVIDRIIGGQLGVFDVASTRLVDWWQPPAPGSLRFSSDGEVEDAAREVLNQVVADHMRAVTPVTCFLTGGLDTAAVAGTAARLQSPQRIMAITRKPGGPLPDATDSTYFDETAMAAKTASCHANMDWHKVPDDTVRWGEDDPEQWRIASGLPLWSLSNLAWFFPLFRFMAARGSAVALTGGLGNACFSQEGDTLLPELFTRLRWISLLGNLRNMSRVEGVDVFRLFARTVVYPLLSPRLFLRRIGYSATRPWSYIAPLNAGLAERLDLTAHLEKGGYSLRVSLFRRDLALMRQRMRHTERTNDCIGPLRAMSGIDLRAPLADRRILEFFGALPMDQFLKDGVRRSLPRRLIAGLAPPEVTASMARGAQGGEWFHRLSQQRAALTEELADLRQSALARRFVDFAQIDSILAHWPAGANEAQANRSTYRVLLENGFDFARFLAAHERGAQGDHRGGAFASCPAGSGV